MAVKNLASVVVCALVNAVFASGLLAATFTHTFTEGGVKPISGGTYTGAEDANFFSDFANENVGQRNHLPIGSGATQRSRILMRYNELNLLAGQTVTNASLELTLQGTTTASNTINLFQINPTNWVEGNGVGVSGGAPTVDDLGVTWNRIDQTSFSPAGGPLWATPGLGTGTDRGTTVLGTFNFVGSTPVGTVYNIALNAAGINLVQNWIDGVTPNGGFLLQAQTESGAGIAFHSAQATLLANHPRFIIETFVADPAPPAPEPATFVSLALGMCLIVQQRKQRRGR